MIDVFPIRIESGDAYVLTAEIIGVFPSKRFDRCVLYINGYDGPLEVCLPAEDVAALWHAYLLSDFDEDSGEESGDE